MSQFRIDPKTTALLLIDLQNDTLHPEGAYRRAGVGSEAMAALPEKLAPLCQALRKLGGWIIGSHFTILEGKAGKPLISEHALKLRPFLKDGDFKRGSWGHAFVETLPQIDVHIDKFAPSAFDMSPLEWLLHHIKAETMLIAGMTTPVSIQATLRDAVQRDFRPIILQDGVAALDAKQHASALSEMAKLAPVRSCADVLALLT